MDRERFGPGPSIRSDWKTPDVSIKKYTVNSLLDPFDTVEPNNLENK